MMKFPPALKKRMPAAHRVAQDLVFRHIPRAVMFVRSLRWRAASVRPALASVVRQGWRSRGTRRSVVFLHNNYYHFYYLARALRRRGWDAITVSLEAPDGPHSNYYHGEDVNVFSPLGSQYVYNMEEFFEQAKRRFDLLHFSGDGHMSFFPHYCASEEPPDIVEWKTLGHKIAYTINGCNSGVAQSSVAQWSRLDGGESVCDKCAWQHEPSVCSDERNLAWGRKVERFCDVIFTEASPALDYQAGAKTVREPASMCLDPSFWRPDLPVPSRFRIARKPGELLVYHAFGNMDARTQNGRNIKGTGAVRAAIERLQAEGIPVRLVFVTGMKSTEVRFLQVQCDVIVDQLNYGRYGATAREGMMLGKPTVCYINPSEPGPEHRLSCMSELPLVSATERTVYQVLKELLLNAGKREAIGKASRAYALKWHGADACAERYEQLYDDLMRGRAERPLSRAGEIAAVSCSGVRLSFPVNGRSVRVLDGVDLTVPKGRIVGILGRNGAGKSTLLRVLGGIYHPTAGTVHRRGRTACLLEPGWLGNRMMSGREYAGRSLLLQDATRRELPALLEEIREFSELGGDFDSPLYTLSTGMAARLFFATATAIPHDIYLIDEFLAVGDEHFQAKCWRRMRDRLSRGASGVLVTHDWTAVLKLCEESHLMEKGRFMVSGPTETVVQAYLDLPRELRPETARFSSDNPAAYSAGCQEDAEFRFSVQVNEEVPVLFGYSIELLRVGTGWENLLMGEGFPLAAGTGRQEVSLRIPRLPLAPGRYHLNLFLKSQAGVCDVRSWTHGNGLSLVVEGSPSGSVTRMPLEWSRKEVLT